MNLLKDAAGDVQPEQAPEMFGSWCGGQLRKQTRKGDRRAIAGERDDRVRLVSRADGLDPNDPAVVAASEPVRL